ncbi:hypothetical protein ES703_56589 [subsurface metagenome]
MSRTNPLRQNFIHNLFTFLMHRKLETITKNLRLYGVCFCMAAPGGYWVLKDIVSGKSHLAIIDSSSDYRMKLGLSGNMVNPEFIFFPGKLLSI